MFSCVACFPVAPLQSSPPLHLPSFSCQCVSISCDRASQTQSESPNIYAQTPMCWNTFVFLQDVVRLLRALHASRDHLLLPLLLHRLHLGPHRPLAAHGQSVLWFCDFPGMFSLNIFMLYTFSARHGSVRGVHRSHSTSESQSIQHEYV